VLIPPDKPIGTGSAQEWDRIEARLGTRLPSDYKEFVGMYGAGWIAVPGDEFSVINPFAGWRRRRLEREIANQRAAHASLLEIYGRFGDVPEQPDGLIPWGTNSFRGVCFWEPNSADPDRWTVHSELDDDRMSYPENMTTYLLNVFRGAHDYFIYNVERSELRVPMPFTPARVPREVTVRWLRCNARALSRRPSSRTQASPSRSFPHRTTSSSPYGSGTMSPSNWSTRTASGWASCPSASRADRSRPWPTWVGHRALT
jgi:hypothetical protein